MPDSKTCTKCGETKTLDEFYRLSSSRDGIRPDCKACGAATKRRYVANNRAAYSSRQQAWREANSDGLDRYAREWREANPDYYKEHRQVSPHVGWKASYLKRCRKFGIAGSTAPFTMPDVIARYGDSCFYCEDGAFDHLDHFIPVKAGGPHTLDNVRPACVACNLSKSDLDPDEWLAEQEALDDLTEDELNAAIDEEIAKWRDTA